MALLKIPDRNFQHEFIKKNLRWAWIAFNQGATFGVSGVKWILAVKITITSTLSSFAGGTLGIVYSIVTKQGKTDVMLCINGILGGLASVMASCASITNLESIFIGAVGALLVILATRLLPYLR